MSDFKYTPYVTVPGRPRLERGMGVKALLREPADWRSLVGWLDLQTGELIGPNPRWHLHRLLFLGAWLVFAIALIGCGAIELQFPQALLWLLFASFWAIISRIEYKAWRQAQAGLAAVQSLRVHQ